MQGACRSLLVGLEQQLCITLCGVCLRKGQMAHGKLAKSEVWKGRESWVLGGVWCYLPPPPLLIHPSPANLSVPCGNCSWLPTNTGGREHKCLFSTFLLSDCPLLFNSCLLGCHRPFYSCHLAGSDTWRCLDFCSAAWCLAAIGLWGLTWAKRGQ